MMGKRVLFVWSSAEWSTWDVARGYRNALERSGQFEIRDYKLHARVRYHARGLGDTKAGNLNVLLRCASENIVIEAMRHRADWVFIVSGLALHPDAIWLLKCASIPTVVLFTESPYDDEQQREFHAVYPAMQCFTTERVSATSGWGYLPHAYDPTIHYPRLSTQPNCDVLTIGTLWQERIRMFETVDWSGMVPRFCGTWVAPPRPEDSPVGKFYEEGCIPNADVPAMAADARIALNIFRADSVAQSLNPRIYELAACNAFQLTDYRAELDDVFGKDVVPTFNATNLEEQLRHWLAHTAERRDLAAYMRDCVVAGGHTFDARLQSLLAHSA